MHVIFIMMTLKNPQGPLENGVGPKKIPFKDMSILILGKKKVKFCSIKTHWFQLVCKNIHVKFLGQNLNLVRHVH